MSNMSQEDQTYYDECVRLVSEFFKGDEGKIHLWWHLDNPLLGGIKPLHMIELGRAKKLLHFIKQQISDNEPDLDENVKSVIDDLTPRLPHAKAILVFARTNKGNHVLLEGKNITRSDLSAAKKMLQSSIVERGGR